jgi:hypothetical protein
VGDIIAGVVLIGIVFLFGSSVLLGYPGLLDYVLDGLGLFWIGKRYLSTGTLIPQDLGNTFSKDFHHQDQCHFTLANYTDAYVWLIP